MSKKKALKSEDFGFELLTLMDLQGKIKVEFMSRGASENLAGVLAGEAMHLFTQSKAIKPAHKKAYEDLSSQMPPPLPFKSFQAHVKI